MMLLCIGVIISIFAVIANDIRISRPEDQYQLAGARNDFFELCWVLGLTTVALGFIIFGAYLVAKSVRIFGVSRAVDGVKARLRRDQPS